MSQESYAWLWLHWNMFITIKQTCNKVVVRSEVYRREIRGFFCLIQNKISSIFCSLQVEKMNQEKRIWIFIAYSPLLRHQSCCTASCQPSPGSTQWEEIIHTWEICHNFSIYTTTLWKITQHNECNCKPYERSCKPYASLEFLLSFQKQWEDNSETRKCTKNTPKRQNSEHNENPFSTPPQSHPELSSKPHLLCKEQNSIHCALSINRPSTNIVLKFKHNPVPPAHTQILSDPYFAVITELSSSTCCCLHKALKNF